MKHYLLLIFTLLTFQLMAQDSWTISLDKKQILHADAEDEVANTKKLPTPRANSVLTIHIKEAKKQKGWIRSVVVVNENDEELLRKEDVSVVNILGSELKKLSAGHNKLRIFAISLPSDPEEASRVRVRRVHLCTLDFQ